MNEIYIWKINNCEFEIDIEDAETAERYTSSLKVLSEADEIRDSDIDYSMAIRQYCAVFRKFYDTFIGEGASEKMFEGIKDNIRKYDEVYESLLAFIRNQRIESGNRLSRMVQKYSPKRAKR